MLAPSSQLTSAAMSTFSIYTRREFQTKHWLRKPFISALWIKSVTHMTARGTLVYQLEMLPNLCEEAGVERQTNHSLHVTGATAMFHANIPEKVIQSRTGHLSLKALRTYENTTD